MAAPHPDIIADAKAALRRRARDLRATLDPGLGTRLAGHLLRGLALAPGAAVAGTWPMPGEIDLRPLWARLHANGHAVLLPETPPRGYPLVFRLWTPDTAMLPERFGTSRPDGPVATPDLIIVPFLAFDAVGHRLGYGGGYYDRTLAAHPGVPAIGAGYAALQVDSLPAGPHDRKLDAIFTELGRATPPARQPES
jgi:5-formyltetrahydrofolate cyclo-ligase